MGRHVSIYLASALCKIYIFKQLYALTVSVTSECGSFILNVEQYFCSSSQGPAGASNDMDSRGVKRKAENSDSEPEPEDDVR